MPRIPMTPQEHDDAIRALGRPSKEHESSPNWVADADLDIMATTPHGLWALYRLAYVVQNDGTGEADECAERLRAAHALIDPAELAHRFVAHYHEIRGAAWSEWAPLLDLMGYCGPAWGTVLPLLMSAWNDAAVHEHRDDVRESASSAAARLLPSMPDDEADRLRARLVHPDNPAHHCALCRRSSSRWCREAGRVPPFGASCSAGGIGPTSSGPTSRRCWNSWPTQGSNS
jgi:hypothetical protein